MPVLPLPRVPVPLQPRAEAAGGTAGSVCGSVVAAAGITRA